MLTLIAFNVYYGKFKLKNKKFKQYKKLKSLLDGKYYKGYPLHLVLGSYLGMMTWKPSISLFIGYVLLNVKNFKFPKSAKKIYTFSTKRDDYLTLIKAYFSDAMPEYARIENNKKEKFLGMGASSYALIKGFVFTNKIKCAFIERLKLIVALSIAFKIIDELEKQEIQCEKYIAFNSSYLFESFLSYYFRNRGIKTYSFQHGMYFNYINGTPYDVINYENVCADELLVWGEYSKKEIAPLIPKSSVCSIFGYPASKMPVTTQSTFLDKVLVLLPRDIYIENSYALLEYLKNYKLEYIVRPHPSVASEIIKFINSQEKFFLDTNSVLTETLTQFKYSAVISFNSTAVFEASLCNQSVFLFVTDDGEFKNPGFNEFSLNSDFIAELDDQETKIKSGSFFSPVSKVL
jgi:hypothetical protein